MTGCLQADAQHYSYGDTTKYVHPVVTHSHESPVSKFQTPKKTGNRGARKSPCKPSAADYGTTRISLQLVNACLKLEHGLFCRLDLARCWRCQRHGGTNLWLAKSLFFLSVGSYVVVPMNTRSILITGCSSGIGLACARGLRARGWQVLATARDDDDLDRLENDEGCIALPLELSDPGSIAACAEAALVRTDGKLTALFNNAAYGQLGAVEDLSPDVLRAQFEVNFFGSHDLTRRLVPAMRANGGGRIVQCSSVLGLVAGPYRGAYCASKFALEGLSDALRLELAGTGITVSIIEPGPIRTNFLARAIASFKENIDFGASVHRETYERRLQALGDGGKKTFKLEPEAVLKKLMHAVESPRPKIRYFVSVPTHAAGFLRRVLPDRALDQIAGRM